MEVDSVGIIAILSMLYITPRIVKTWTGVAKIPRVSVENQITTLSVVKIALKFSPCTNKSGYQLKIVFLKIFVHSFHKNFTQRKCFHPKIKYILTT